MIRRTQFLFLFLSSVLMIQLASAIEFSSLANLRGRVAETSKDGLVESASVQRGPDGELNLQLIGGKGAEAIFSLELGQQIDTQIEIRFSVAARNLHSLDERPAVSLVFKVGPDVRRTIPLVPMLTGDYEELGKVPVSAANGLYMDEIQVRVKLAEDGLGMMSFRNFSVTGDGNVIDDAMVSRKLQETNWPLSTISFAHQMWPSIRFKDLHFQPLFMDQRRDESLGIAVLRLVLFYGQEALFPQPEYMRTSLLLNKLAELQNSRSPTLLRVDVRGTEGSLEEQALQADEALRQLLTKLANHAVKDQITGIILELPDLSVVLADADEQFQSWLQQKYGTVKAIQDSWQQQGVAIDDIHLKSDAAQTVLDLMHPTLSRPEMDRRAFRRHLKTEWGLARASAIKKATDHHLLVGLSSRSFDLERLLNSRDVDLLVQPPVQAISENLGIMSHELKFASSCRRKGKLLLVSLSGAWPLPLRATLLQIFGHGAGVIVPQTNVAADGSLRAGLQAASRLRQEPDRTIYDAAFFLDMDLQSSLSREGLADGLQLAGLRSLPALACAVTVDDVSQARMQQYKLTTFAATPALPAATSSFPTNQQEPSVIALTWATGVNKQAVLSPNFISELIKGEMRWLPRRERLFLMPTGAMREELGIEKIDGYLGWFINSWPGGDASAFRLGPSFSPSSSEGKLLARFADSGDPAMWLRTSGKTNIFYSASPFINGEVLRALLIRSGAQLYLYGGPRDRSWIGGNLIIIRSVGDGVRTLVLPEKEPLFEIQRDFELQAASEHRLQLKDGETYIFYRGTWARWLDPAAP